MMYETPILPSAAGGRAPASRWLLAGGSRLGLCLPKSDATVGFFCGWRAQKAKIETDRVETGVDVHLYFPECNSPFVLGFRKTRAVS